MADLNDERIRFYLRNRPQIESWAALRKEAAAAIDEQLERLSDEVNNLGAELGAVVLTRLDGETTPRFLLYRETWWPDPESVRATIGLEWARNKTLLDGAASPYIGARFAISDPDTKILRDRFLELARNIRASDRAWPWWPCYRLVPAEPGFWADFEPYRERVLTELRGAWNDYADVMEQVLVDGRERGDSAGEQ